MGNEEPDAFVSGIKPLGQGASDAWHIAHDQTHTELFFGGSAGPGKTFFLGLFEVTQALKYPGTVGGMFRDTAENLRKSTMVTFFEVIAKSGLRDGTDYIYKESKKLVEWANGSVTYFDYLQFDPRDPNYSRLGGRAYTRACVDEGDGIEERAVDALAGRLRYRTTEFCHACCAEGMAAKSKAVDCDDNGRPIQWECYRCGVWTRGLVPKLIVTGNPGDYWTKYRYVVDREGKAVDLQPHQAKVLVLLDDNPDKAHVASYTQQLERNPDDYDRARLLHGDWNATRKTGREFLHAFEGRKHLIRIPYDPTKALHFTVDFNTAPYMTGLDAQIWQEPEGRWRVHFLKERCLAHPWSNTEALCDHLARDLKEGAYKDHAAGLYFYGDRSGANRSPMERDGIVHNFDLVQKVLRPWLHNHSDRVIRRNPAHTVVRDFCNAYLAGKLDIWVTFDPSMAHTASDMLNTKEAADGTILKQYATDPVTRVRFEKYGHCLQAHYYLVVGAFDKQFREFVERRKVGR
jgi:hypothetical protein